MSSSVHEVGDGWSGAGWLTIRGPFDAAAAARPGGRLQGASKKRASLRPGSDGAAVGRPRHFPAGSVGFARRFRADRPAGDETDIHVAISARWRTRTSPRFGGHDVDEHVAARFGVSKGRQRPAPCLAHSSGDPAHRRTPNRTAAVMDTDALVTRIKSEFNESPGMCLTLRQGARLWGIAPEECAKVVDRLVAEQFLRWTRNGELVRSESGGYRSRAGLETRPLAALGASEGADGSVGPDRPGRQNCSLGRAATTA